MYYHDETKLIIKDGFLHVDDVAIVPELTVNTGLPETASGLLALCTRKGMSQSDCFCTILGIMAKADDRNLGQYLLK